MNSSSLTETLEAWGNQLQGSLPSELGDLSSLEYIGLASNSFTGVLPTQLFEIEPFQGLWVDHNRFTGRIPSELGRYSDQFGKCLGMPELKTLYCLYLLFIDTCYPTDSIILGNNDFTGTIPTEIWSLKNLQNLVLDGLGLTGTIPTQLSAFKDIGKPKVVVFLQKVGYAMFLEMDCLTL